MWVLGSWEPVHRTADLVIIGELGDGTVLGYLRIVEKTVGFKWF